MEFVRGNESCQCPYACFGICKCNLVKCLTLSYAVARSAFYIEFAIKPSASLWISLAIVVKKFFYPPL